MTRKRKTPRQSAFDFPNGWGGVRKGAGRKARGGRAGVVHREREGLASRFPVLVTLRLAKGLPSLRRVAPLARVLDCFAASNERSGLRITQYSVQSNHVHLIVEAKDRTTLSRGMQGLAVRLARGLNRLWGRKGTLFADRYHDRILRTPSEVRNALLYVLNNYAKHSIPKTYPDAASSGAWFTGWKDHAPLKSLEQHPAIVAARTWLQKKGWRHRGLLDPYASPGPVGARTM